MSLHPGVVRTTLAKNHHLACGIFYVSFILTYPLYWFGTKNVNEGAQTSLYTIFEETSNLKSGGYYADCEQRQIDSESNTPEIRSQLWSWTCKQLGINKDCTKAD